MVKPLVYAHRGASLELPENTLPAFQRALDLGADALELDAHLTSDGFVVVSHDHAGIRMAGLADEIRKTPLREVLRWDVGWGFVDPQGERPFAGKGYSIPTFAEVLAAFPGILLNVDAKQESPSMIKPLLDVIASAGAEERVRIASFSACNLAEARRLGWRGKLGMAQSEVTRLFFLPKPAVRAIGLHADAAQVPLSAGPFALASRSFIDKVHELGLRVDFWTVNDGATAERLAALGADGIMTDDPATVAPVVRAWRERNAGHPNAR